MTATVLIANRGAGT